MPFLYLTDYEHGSNQFLLGAMAGPTGKTKVDNFLTAEDARGRVHTGITTLQEALMPGIMARIQTRIEKEADDGYTGVTLQIADIFKETESDRKGLEKISSIAPPYSAKHRGAMIDAILLKLQQNGFSARALVNHHHVYEEIAIHWEPKSQ